MISFQTAARLALIAALITWARVAQAVAQTGTDDPVAQLGRYIRVLAGSPRDLGALLGAGRAALDVGDPNAALGFFARAEEVAPASGAAKAGLGSSLVAIERPDDALRLFGQAVTLGVPEANVARDRGLAYDLRGDGARAQRDYALAMTVGRDDELVRRYALSLGIAGDRAAALAMLDPLLRKQDQGAWRAQAFILAMTGDVPGANGVARQLMIPAMANAMAPLLSRLATLNAAGRAHAVTFGTVPADGTQLAMVAGDPFVATGPAPRPTARPVTGGLTPWGAPLAANAALAVKPPRLFATVTPRVGPAPVSPAAAGIARVASAAPPPPPAPAAVGATLVGPPRDAEASTQPAFEVPAQPVLSRTPAPASASASASAPAPANRLAGILAGIEPEAQTVVELPSVRELRAARAAARKKLAALAAQAAADKAEQAAAAEAAAAAKRYPARSWVQVATGRNEAGLATSWRRIRDDHEGLLKGQSAWSVPYRATNRILVGPFKSPAAARELIRKLGKDGLSATSYDSVAGEEIVKIAAQNH